MANIKDTLATFLLLNMKSDQNVLFQFAKTEFLEIRTRPLFARTEMPSVFFYYTSQIHLHSMCISTLYRWSTRTCVLFL